MRIASLSPAATEILFGLGLGFGAKREHEIVCVDQFSNFPDEAKAIPHLRGHAKMNPEELRPFAPELVLTGTVVQAKLAELLRGTGFGVVHQDPRTVNEIYAAIRALGAIVEEEKEAEKLILSMQQRLNAVKQKAAHLERHPNVYVEEWPALPSSSGRHDPPFASGNWVPELVRIAGGTPFPIAPGELSRAVTLEEVRVFNPELIVISWCGAGATAPKELLLTRPGWDFLPAAMEDRACPERSRRVRVIDDSLLNRPGPRIVEGAERLYGWMFEMLH